MKPLIHPDDERITNRVKARFWARVDQSKPDGCWPWTGALVGKSGYGRAYLDDMSKVYAHRLSLILSGRAFTPQAPDALHSCDNPRCVNPSHLRPGNKLANAADMVARGRALTGDRAPFRKKPQACPRGEKHQRHILKEPQVHQILADYRPGVVTVPKLAARFNVSESAITGILTRKNWKHLQPAKSTYPQYGRQKTA